MKFAFVLGNGTSRSSVNPVKLKEHGKVYACNAAYRDFYPHYLIAVDSKMVLEIAETDVAKYSSVWTNPNKLYENIPNLNFFKPSRGWSSGPTALYLASTHKPKTVYIMGFDYKGLDGKYINNVYANTRNYKKSTDPATYYGNWIKQTESVIKEFKDIKYIRLINEQTLGLDWSMYKNYSEMQYTEFKKTFNV